MNDPSGNNPAGFRVEASGTGLRYIDKPPFAFNELSAAPGEAFLAEIINYGTQSVSLSNCVFRRLGTYAGEYLLPNLPLAPGDRAVFNVTEFGIHVLPGDRLVLCSADRKYVLDAVTARRYPRARWPEGTGAWRHPDALTFGTPNSVAFHEDVVINEIMYHPRAPQGPDYRSPEQWLELYNRGGQTADLSGWRIEIEGETAFTFVSGTALAPDGYLVVALDADYLRALYPDITILGNLSRRLPRGGGRIELFDAAGMPLHPDAGADEAGNPADCVVYGDAAPWPAYADGLGASLELVDPRSDNSRPEAWCASDDSAKAQWHSYAYTGVATKETAASPTLWKEFVLGVIGSGELLLDDLSVVHDPSGAAVELLQNGDFEGGISAWRIIGNHRHSEAVSDPDNAGNTVLRLVSTGYTEHMHNHAETTLADGASIVNGQMYRIAFRAKWVAGCNRLLSRLYFNRLPRLTEIAMPVLCGTPGARNSRYAANRGPTFRDLSHAPVVPSADQAVTVSVVASDPDGVASAVLRYAVNSGAFVALPMTVTGASDSGTQLAAQIPAQAEGSIVQFYVEAFDSTGASAFMPAGGEASRALYEVAGSGGLIAKLRKIRIVMTPDDAAFLHTPINVMSNDRMGCTLITDEKRAFYECGVHLQGSERGRPNSARVGFNVRLPYDQPYRGVLDTITVDRSGGYSGKGGKQDEILLKHAINRVGGLPGMYDDLCQIFAPRPQEDGRGLLILAKYNSEFLDTQYRDGGRGELFKLELVYYPETTLTGDPQSYKLPNPDKVLGTDVKDLGDDPEAYRWTFLKENRRDRNHYAPMVQLAKAFSLSGAELDARMDELMDVDQWMRAVAFLSLIGNNDGYTYGNSHNAIFYFRPEDGKALLFPWDMDFSFVASTSAAFPGTGSPNTLKLINRPANLHAYYGHLYDLTAVTGDAVYMGEWAARYAGLLGENWSAAVTYLKNRADYVRSQLPAMVDFAITSNAGADFSVDHSPVVITGNGWITVKTITVNGVQYPVTWNTPTAWSITVPLPELINTLELQAYDLHGTLMPGGADSITVTNTGPLAPQPVRVNEWMAVNNGPGGFPDPADGKFDDWFELYNPNATAVDLSGYTLTDNLSRPDKWTVPSNTVIGAHGFLLIWADGEPEQSAVGGLHASFKLDGDGEALGLFSPEGVLQHAVTFGRQVANVSQGFYPDGAGGAVCDMPRWTPAAANRIGAPAVPDIVVFSAADGEVIIQAQTDAGHAYVIEYKNDLEDALWTPLFTNRVAGELSSFIDVAPGVGRRFYRAVRLP